MKFSPANYLTTEQRRVLCVVLLLLLSGLAVKVWRTANSNAAIRIPNAESR